MENVKLKARRINEKNGCCIKTGGATYEFDALSIEKSGNKWTHFIIEGVEPYDACFAEKSLKAYHEAYNAMMFAQYYKHQTIIGFENVKRLK